MVIFRPQTDIDLLLGCMSVPATKILNTKTLCFYWGNIWLFFGLISVGRHGLKRQCIQEWIVSVYVCGLERDERPKDLTAGIHAHGYCPCDLYIVSLFLHLLAQMKKKAFTTKKVSWAIYDLVSGKLRGLYILYYIL